MDLPRLCTCFRSGAAHRIRIVSALKEAACESVPVHLVRGGGEHLSPAFRALNPQAQIPVLGLAGGDVLTQSPAIIEHLEERVPEPPLLPSNPVARAKARGGAAVIGCGVHPLDNVGALGALRRFGLDDAAASHWTAQWITLGLTAVEQLVGEDGWCFGPAPGLADLYLAPQVFSALRFKVALIPSRASAGWPASPGGTAPSSLQAPQNQPDAE